MEIFTREAAAALYEEWRSCAAEPELRRELEEIAPDAEAVYDRFFAELEFGTGGMRGLLGAGIRRMNVYTVARATRGLAALLRSSGAPLSCAVAYDSRRNSRLFAETAARILSGGGIRVYLFPRPMPTPALSFAVRRLGCGAGVVITASHNPAEYNGYKVYGGDGCQITPDTARKITAFIADSPYFAVAGEPDGEILTIGEELVDEFIRCAALAPPPSGGEGELSAVYTPLCGAGGECVLRALALRGFTKVRTVPGQDRPDGSFPGCPFPNPELPEAMEAGLALCKESGADLLLATDPDCDRVGVAVREGGEYIQLTGNELGVVLLEYILERRRELGTLPERPVIIKTTVTTAMAADMAREAGAELYEVPTGFKYIGEKLAELEAAGETERFIFGFEESCGYLCSPYVRDKDGVSAAVLVCEAARYYKAGGETLCGVLDRLRARFGCHLSRLHSLVFEGSEGLSRIQTAMAALRSAPPSRLAGRALEELRDYALPPPEGGAALPLSDMLGLRYEGGLAVAVRPSGTEPKLKLYLSAAEKTLSASAALLSVATGELSQLLH